MAIDIFCYSTLRPDSMQNFLTDFVSRNPEIFPSKYYASEASCPGEISKEIAFDFGMRDACSIFLLHLNDKSFSLGVQEMADMVYKEFGRDEMLILFEGETLIEPTYK